MEFSPERIATIEKKLWTHQMKGLYDLEHADWIIRYMKDADKSWVYYSDDLDSYIENAEKILKTTAVVKKFVIPDKFKNQYSVLDTVESSVYEVLAIAMNPYFSYDTSKPGDRFAVILRPFFQSYRGSMIVSLPDYLGKVDKEKYPDAEQEFTFEPFNIKSLMQGDK